MLREGACVAESSESSEGELGGGRPRLVVGVGASAGGLEALQRFFEPLPERTGVAFVVVQHLSPDFKSLMVELLGRKTSLPVERATDGVEVCADRIYVIPPRHDLTLEGGRLRLREQAQQGLHLPIDEFFESMAADCRERCVAVVLSGSGSDGTRGVREVKGAGGLIVVQDEVTAKFDGMPRSSLATGLADYVLAPEHMHQAIMDYAQVQGERAVSGSVERLTTREQLQRITSAVQRATGLDFGLYKDATVLRRLERRMQVRRLGDLSDYARLVEGDAEEAEALYRDLLIGVTRFFRDREAWSFLEGEVLAEVAQRVPAGTPVRVWCAGCSTGEEAYSLGIAFAEAMERAGVYREVKIFATDVDARALECGSAGVYPTSVVADLPPERLERFFQEAEGGWRVRRDLREGVIFARHNVVADPPFTRMDVVTCRNLLIYMQAALQRRALGALAYGLKPGGVLFLGPSETPGSVQDHVQVLSSKWKVYRLQFPVPALVHAGFQPPAVEARGAAGRDRLLERAYQGLAEALGVACLVVDSEHNLLHSFGQTGSLFEIPSGRTTFDVTRLVPSLLGVALRGALSRLGEGGKRDEQQRVRVGDRVFDLRVRALDARASEPARFVVVVEEQRAEERPRAVASEGEQLQRRVTDLDQELQFAKENLQATIEELEASNEELQATNEELLAANEELQATNEELQSVNEELHTVNSEYQGKIEELTALNADMDNLIQATQIGTIFLDVELRIRRLTPAVTEFLPVREQDVGRRIDDFSAREFVGDVFGLARRVLETGDSQEQEFQLRSVPPMLVRYLPYRSGEEALDGVVVTFTNVERVKRLEAHLQAVLDSLPQHVAVLDGDGVILRVNAAWSEFARANGDPDGAQTGVGCNYLAVCKGDERGEEVGVALLEVARGERERFQVEYPCHSADRHRWFVLDAVPLRGEQGRLLVSHLDITRRVQAEQGRGGS